MRRRIVAGNWKMNKDIHDTALLINELKDRMAELKNEVDVVICPPFTSLVIAKTLINNTFMKLGAQNMSQHEDGAFTGEISSKMLIAVGCEYIVLGHSERRQYFKETDELINAKLKKALKDGLKPIVCIGETLEEREAGVTHNVIAVQVKGVLNEITAPEVGKIVIAYEPVWAIGTGKNATPEQANQVHKEIRKLIGRAYSWEIAEKTLILYGGSVNAQNAHALFSQSDIDGGLIGGASLKADIFINIVQAGIEAKKG